MADEGERLGERVSTPSAESKTVMDPVTINDAETLIEALEDIRIREEAILKGRSESVQAKRPLSDVLEKWTKFGKLEPRSLSGSVPSNYGMSASQKIIGEIGKVEYWIVRKIAKNYRGETKIKSTMEEIKSYFGTDRRKHKPMSLQQLIEVQSNHATKLGEMLRSSKDDSTKLRDNTYDICGELLKDKIDARLYLEEMKGLQDYNGAVRKRAEQIEEEKVSPLDKDRIRKLINELNRLSAPLDHMIYDCRATIDWAEKALPDYEKFERIMDGYVNVIHVTGRRIEDLLRLLNHTNKIVQNVIEGGKITEGLVQAIRSVTKGVFVGIGQLSAGIRDICHSYGSLEKARIPEQLAQLLDQPLSDLYNLERTFSQKGELPEFIRGLL